MTVATVPSTRRTVERTTASGVPDPLRIDDVDRLDRGRGRRQGEQPNAVTVRARLRDRDLRCAVTVHIRRSERLAPHRRETLAELNRWRLYDSIAVQIGGYEAIALAGLWANIGRAREDVGGPWGAGNRDRHRHHAADREVEAEVVDRFGRCGDRRRMRSEGSTECEERTHRCEQDDADESDRAELTGRCSPALAGAELPDEVIRVGGPRRRLPHPDLQLVIDARHACSPHRSRRHEARASRQGGLGPCTAGS